MVIITLQRNKCIGCNYCAEMAPSHFKMFKKDGKSVLLYAKEKKGFDAYKDPSNWVFEEIEKAKKACPVKIISVKKTK